MPTYAELSRRISALYWERGEEWAGIPMPLPGHRLTVESRSPWRDTVDELQAIIDDGKPSHRHEPSGDFTEPGWVVRNEWWSQRLRQHVSIVQRGTTYVAAVGRLDYVERFLFTTETMDAAHAWTLETEAAALARLRTLITRHLFNAYVLTGAFLETSRRSGVTYVFRRCRPTVAVHCQRILCCLCLHPLGYYEQTHAGSMCPTDDVIAHLLMMRADEPFYWRRANQHAPWRPESGL